MNRLPPSETPDDKQKRINEEIQRRLNAIRDNAAILYDLMEPGMTIDIQLEEPPAIITPNRPPRVKRLLITKPMMVLEVKG
jgi:hypothetical protein